MIKNIFLSFVLMICPVKLRLKNCHTMIKLLYLHQFIG